RALKQLSPRAVEGSRGESFKVTWQDPSTFAGDDEREFALRVAEGPLGEAPNGAGEARALQNLQESGAIHIHGAREHNLKNIDVAIPRDQMVVITGLSGSEKPTLAAIVKQVETAARRGPLKVLAPLVKARKGFHTDVARWAERNGFDTLFVDGQFIPIAKFQKLERFKEHSIDVVVGVIDKK